MDMEAIIAIAIIVVSLIASANKAKKVKQNAPGQSDTPIQPLPQPTRPMASEQGTFWQQMSNPTSSEPTVRQHTASQKGHQAVNTMKEGDSRECEHGSVGGSMAYTSHSEGVTQKNEKKVIIPQTTVEPMVRPSMNAEEMRRAVIMAEILKRPQERMMEQNRRWGAR